MPHWGSCPAYKSNGDNFAYYVGVKSATQNGKNPAAVDLPSHISSLHTAT